MFRSFCVGVLFGFFFGSSKKGREVREQVDGLLTDLVTDDTRKMIDEKKENLSELASRSMAKFKNKNGNSDHSVEEDFQPEPKDEDNKKAEEDNADPEGLLDVQKAQELADKLGAKPATPEDENLAAFHHADDELKSA